MRRCRQSCQCRLPPPHRSLPSTGWAIADWETHEQAQSLRGFIDAVPKDKFVIIDMSVDGKGEWQKWNNASYWGAKFIWTTLHNFGGTDGMKGDLALINEIPFAGLAPEGPSSSVWGTGFTPEGDLDACLAHPPLT